MQLLLCDFRNGGYHILGHLVGDCIASYKEKARKAMYLYRRNRLRWTPPDRRYIDRSGLTPLLPESISNPVIWALDHTYDGFKWVDCKSDNKCVFGYTRTDGKQTLLTLFNFSDKEATIAPELDGKVTMLLNTDWEPFGGSTKRKICKAIPETIPAFGGMFFTLTKPMEYDK